MKERVVQLFFSKLNLKLVIKPKNPAYPIFSVNIFQLMVWVCNESDIDYYDQIFKFFSFIRRSDFDHDKVFI